MDYKFIKVIKLPKSDKKKYVAIFKNIKTNRIKQIKFGASGYSDYPTHKDEKRKELYIKRHSGMGEKWGNDGVLTAGWWSRWFLWEKPTIKESKIFIKNKLQKIGY